MYDYVCMCTYKSYKPYIHVLYQDICAHHLCLSNYKSHTHTKTSVVLDGHMRLVLGVIFFLVKLSLA